MQAAGGQVWHNVRYWIVRAGPLAALVALWFLFADFPLPPQTWLDPSWHAALVDAHLQSRQFGTDIAFTFGPLGFLTSHFYLPEAIGVKLAWELAGKIAMLAGVVAISRSLPPAGRIISLTGLGAMSGLAGDPVFYIFLTFAFVGGLFRDATPYWARGALLFGAAFLSLIKVTYGLLSLAGVVLLVVHALVLRRPLKSALLSAVGYFAACLLLWLAAGQNPANIPAFLTTELEISRGYSWAMSLSEPEPVFLAGVATLAVSLVFCGWAILRAPGERRRSLLAPAAFCALSILLAWRHGFTRADAHVIGFFAFCLSLGAALPGWLSPGLRAGWSAVIPVFAITGILCFDATLIRDLPRSLGERVSNSFQGVRHLPSFSERFTAAYRETAASVRDPALAAIVGDAPIDWISYEQAWLILAGLDYRPRPVFQSYSAYTPALMRTNAAFYRSSDAPEFVCVAIQSIDGRYPMQDDAPLLLEVVRDYEPVRRAQGYVLMRRRTAPRPDLVVHETLVPPVEVAFGQDLAVPDSHGVALWVRIVVRPTDLGRLRAAFYKPPALRLVVTDESGRQSAYRLIPGIAEEGFLIQPVIENTDDFGAFVDGAEQRRSRSVRVETAADSDQKYWQAPVMSFDRLPDFSLAAPAAARLDEQGSGLARLESADGSLGGRFRIQP